MLEMGLESSGATQPREDNGEGTSEKLRAPGWEEERPISSHGDDRVTRMGPAHLRPRTPIQFQLRACILSARFHVVDGKNGKVRETA